ncbi:hypothetical protein [Acetobacter sp. UBA5411]|uniref:hypothetical protein n=1 Tax=Acetobacter sp. UBA5411 TaxID=1945905 RepID=UPI0025BB1004|nr:hypothetical protein [Acetobacter sp. UBA5411]
MLQIQLHRTGTDIRGKLLHSIAHQTFFSGKKVSANPGAVQPAEAPVLNGNRVIRTTYKPEKKPRTKLIQDKIESSRMYLDASWKLADIDIKLKAGKVLSDADSQAQQHALKDINRVAQESHEAVQKPKGFG